MNAPSFAEDHISQIPALQLLQKLGYTYLSPEEALRLRGGKTTNALLEGVVQQQLEKINHIHYKGADYAFSPANIRAGIQALKELPLNEGYIHSCEYVYNLLTLGKALEQSIEGDKKSFTLQYVDWKNLSNNVFHVSEEFSQMRSASKDHYRPDIVLFVNGIPFSIIECKRPDMDAPLEQAISQHLRNQQEDGIRSLYAYAHLLLSLATNSAKFGTNATKAEFWAHWREEFGSNTEEHTYHAQLQKLKNTPLTPAQKDTLFHQRFHYVRHYFEAMEQEAILPAAQDEYLYSLCRPERLLDLVHNFILFDAGEKKIARYQQYAVLKKTMQRIRSIEGGKRRGGVIWHTQGSGKSLTMVLLAQAIALEKSILNPKIILVTDRTDLDDQIKETFKKCGKYVEQATTGQRLVELLQSKSDAVITTVINKFEAAVKKLRQPLSSHDIFVLIDEGHRTQYGSFNIQMQKVLPNACFLAFTGTPLMKSEKSTAAKFGGIIDPPYTVDRAVADKAVVPLLYEGRHGKQTVNEQPIDTYFKKISEPLNDYQKADLKRKFSRADQLNIADQKIYANAWDISTHYRDSFQGTGMKGQLVCPGKEAAIKYKNYLDEIAIVHSELLISPPDDREGEESAYGESSDAVKTFWKKAMDEHGTQKRYEKNIISRFKNQPYPEIIIVVDKLLTGFDAPCNTVLYLTRKLKAHTLLQAIARVNRVFPGKDFGYIIDYYGIIGELNDALTMYSAFDDFDEEDLAGTLHSINEEIRKLPQQHSELWDIFKEIANKSDAEAFQQLLRDEARRTLFYEKLSLFARTLKIALSSLQFHKNSPEAEIEGYKNDLKNFLNLRQAVRLRYSDTVDFKQYEAQIQKLIDKHIQSGEVLPITQLVNIFDKDAFQREVEEAGGEVAQAERIASRTAKYINEKMDEDPAFYKKLSEMLKDAIRDYETHRISDSELLAKTRHVMNTALDKREWDVPDELRERDAARALFNSIELFLEPKISERATRRSMAQGMALSLDDLIRSIVVENNTPIIDWQREGSSTLKELRRATEDFLLDVARDEHHIPISYEEVDETAEQLISIAKVHYKS